MMNARKSVIVCSVFATTLIAGNLAVPNTPSIDWEVVSNARPIIQTLGADEYNESVREAYQEATKKAVNVVDLQREADARASAKKAAEEADAAEELAAEQTQQTSTSTGTYTSKGSIGSLSGIIAAESGGDPYAVNGQYKGIGQLSESYYEAYLGKSWSEVAGDYAAQEKAMLAYIDSRYGSEDAAVAHWESYGWY